MRAFSAPALEALNEPLYFQQTYPEEGRRELWFWKLLPDLSAADAPRDRHISNVPFVPYRSLRGEPPQGEPYYHLPAPQHFEMVGLALRPVFGRLDVGLELQFFYDLRRNATFTFCIGCKTYVSGPLDHILDLDCNPRRKINLSRFLDVTVTTKESKGEKMCLHIPSGQEFSLVVEQRDGEAVRGLTVMLRAYILGTWFREPA